MKPIEFEVQLFDTTSFAADGSNIPRRSCEEYLQSSDYQTIIRDKVAIGGLSHKDRRLKPELKGIVGMDDQVLINDNALFYITKLYFKDGSNFLYARAKTFDPDLFAGKRAENIYNLMGLIKSGVRMPVSVVIQALWSKRGVAEKILRIKGFDFTQNPSFKGAGDIHVFSSVNIEDKQICASDDEIKIFSQTEQLKDCDVFTKVFSSTGEISIVDDDSIIDGKDGDLFGKLLSQQTAQSHFSFSDVVSTYGYDSPQVNLVKPYQGREITPKLLKSLSQDHNQTIPSQTDTIEHWIDIINDEMKCGDRLVLQNLFKSNRDKLQNIIISVPNDDPNRDDLIRHRLVQYFRTIPNDSFSEVSSVTSRLRTLEQPRFTKIDRIIKSHRDFFKSKKLTENQRFQTKLLFLQDINLLLKDALDDIYKGKTFNSVYALGRYGDDVKTAGITLSQSYRKLLISEKIMKFVPKGVYGEWLVDIRNLYQALLRYTFGEELTELQLNTIDIK